MDTPRKAEPRTSTPSRVTRGIETGLTPLFSTWVYCSDEGPVHLHRDLERLTHELMRDERNAAQRTNDGGWHYAFDLFEMERPPVAELREAMHGHVQTFLDCFGSENTGAKHDFRLRGWLNVNRQGDSNVLHCHPGSFVSGVYYVKVPEEMRGGEIRFRDPRGPAVAMYETPGIDLPWVGSGIGIPAVPVAGRVLLFPSWLQHGVSRFEGSGERISVAFNASNP